MGITNQVIVWVDAFSKLVKLYAETRPATRAVLNITLNKYIPGHGHVKRVISDNGKQFSSKLLSDTLTHMGFNLFWLLLVDHRVFWLTESTGN